MMNDFFLLFLSFLLFNHHNTTTTKGLYFQIRDDYCNLSLKEYSENKSFCEDLTEGKFSFPIIHAIQSQSQDKQVLREYKHFIFLREQKK